MGFHTYLTCCKHVKTTSLLILELDVLNGPCFIVWYQSPWQGNAWIIAWAVKDFFIIPELLFLRWWLQYFLNIGDVLENQNILTSCRAYISCLLFNAWLLWSLSVSHWDPQEVGSTPRSLCWAFMQASHWHDHLVALRLASIYHVTDLRHMNIHLQKRMLWCGHKYI